MVMVMIIVIMLMTVVMIIAGLLFIMVMIVVMIIAGFILIMAMIVVMIIAGFLLIMVMIMVMIIACCLQTELLRLPSCMLVMFVAMVLLLLRVQPCLVFFHPVVMVFAFVLPSTSVLCMSMTNMTTKTVPR